MIPYLQTSLLKRAEASQLVQYDVRNLRDFAEGPHRIVDGRPFGGGEGMVLRADVLSRGCAALKRPVLSSRTILLSPQGQALTPALARDLLGFDHILMICGHYEGVDQRFIETEVDLEVSIGDYVLTGGELPALVLTDWLVRQIPGAVGNPESVAKDSFTGGRLKHPQYTRPRIFGGHPVPEVLTSGDHLKIEAFRLEESDRVTREKRPDLCVS